MASCVHIWVRQDSTTYRCSLCHDLLWTTLNVPPVPCNHYYVPHRSSEALGPRYKAFECTRCRHSYCEIPLPIPPSPLGPVKLVCANGVTFDISMEIASKFITIASALEHERCTPIIPLPTDISSEAMFYVVDLSSGFMRIADISDLDTRVIYHMLAASNYLEYREMLAPIAAKVGERLSNRASEFWDEHIYPRMTRELVTVIATAFGEYQKLLTFYETFVRSKFNVESVRQALEAKVSERASKRESVFGYPLEYAAFKGFIHSFQFLLRDSTADDIIETRGVDIVKEAIRNHQHDILKLILEDGRVNVTWDLLSFVENRSAITCAFGRVFSFTRVSTATTRCS